MASTYDITLRVRTDNAAMADDWRGELSRILRNTSMRLASTIGEPEDLDGQGVLDTNGNTVGSWQVVAVTEGLPPNAGPWAALLRQLPVLEEGVTSNKHIDLGHTGEGALRVWLSRASVADGEPFASTVYVEQLRPDHGAGLGWYDVGYFDGEEPEPAPTGLLGVAYALTAALAARPPCEPCGGSGRQPAIVGLDGEGRCPACSGTGREVPDI